MIRQASPPPFQQLKPGPAIVVWMLLSSIVSVALLAGIAWLVTR